MKRVSGFAAAVVFLCAAAERHTFTNPLFAGGDPWVTLEDGTYYYSASGCEPGHEGICIKSSRTLTGLRQAPWKSVWSPNAAGDANGTDVWAPEIHKVNGHWFIYYAADPNHNNEQHRIFVLRADSDDPLGTYSEASTGELHGELSNADVHWGIDPNVFVAGDRKLYLTWSCTNFVDSRFPQRICLARMRDAEHLDGEPVAISTPTEPWETRDKPIQEGPVGYVRDGATYITYSASASWIPNDYAVGVLSNRSSRMLDPAEWRKSGPVFDHHGKTFGPGSVVFVASPDGRQYWNLYHAIDRLDCKPAYSCRDIRMQPMHFDGRGYPVLGVPYDPGVPIHDPSGDDSKRP